MKTPILSVNMKVQCSDGCVHSDVKMYVCDNRKVFLDCDDCKIENVETIQEATLVVHPALLLAVMLQCKEAE